LAYRHSTPHHSSAGNLLAVAMLKLKPQFDRPTKIPLEIRRKQQAAEASVAVADYLRAQQSVLERMIALRAARLKQVAEGEK